MSVPGIRIGARSRIALSLLLSVLLFGCWQPGNPLDPASPDFGGELYLKVTSVKVVPGTSVLEANRTGEFRAMVTFEDGSTEDLTEDCVWSSSAPAVATVSNVSGTKGVVTTVAPGGPAEIRARYRETGGKTGKSMLTVSVPHLESIRIDPEAAENPAGVPVQYRAFGVYSDGVTRDITENVTSGGGWDTTAPAPSWADAVVTDDGVDILYRTVSSATPGTYAVTASLDGVSSGDSDSSASYFVNDAQLLSVTVERSSGTGPIISGDTAEFTATGHYTNGSSPDLTPLVDWSSGDTTVASFTGLSGGHAVFLGTVPQGGTTGTATLTATYTVSGSSPVVTESGSFSLTVDPPVATAIRVTAPASQVNYPDTLRFTARWVFSDGSTAAIPGSVSVSWSTTDSQTSSGMGGIWDAVLSPTFITASPWSRTVTVNATAMHPTAGSLSSGAPGDSCTVTLQLDKLSLTVTPGAWTMTSLTGGVPSTVQFTATENFAGAVTRTVTDLATWTSGNTKTAVMETAVKGRAKATGQGKADIIAHYDGFSNEASPAVLTVNDGEVLAVDLTPALPVTVEYGDALTLTATGTFADDTTGSVTGSVLWLYDHTGIIEVESNGDVRYLSYAGGTVKVSALIDGRYDIVTVTVTPRAEFFVRSDGDDSGYGTEARPFRTIGKAITTANAMYTETTQPGTVRVAAGTYAEAVNLLPHVSLLGGWNASDWNDRRPADWFTPAYATEIAPPAGNAVALSADSAAITGTVIEGFVLTGGVESGVYNSGLHLMDSSPTVKSCLLRGGSGESSSGIFSQDASPLVANCVILGGNGTGISEALIIDGGSPVLVNNIIRVMKAQAGTVAVGVDIGVPPGAATSPRIDNNIFFSSSGGIGIREQNASSDPSSFGNNDFSGLAGGVYEDFDTSTTFMTVAALPFGSGNVSADPSLDADYRFGAVAAGDPQELVTGASGGSTGGLDLSAAGPDPVPGFPKNTSNQPCDADGTARTVNWSMGPFEKD